MTDPPAIDPGAVTARLLARRDELRHLGESTRESRRPVELDQSRVGRLSRMDALQGQAMALETDRRRQVALRLIEAALGRVESGDYGFCLSCGEEIAAKRLELDPTASLCIDCAQIQTP
jgi:DnaK suppressor protein